MKLTLNLKGPDGENRKLEAEALPLHDRPVVPPGAAIDLAPDDLERLKKATDRLRRCNVSREALGDHGLSIGTDDRRFIVAKKPENELALKALALDSRPFFLTDDPLYFPALVKLNSFAASPELARVFRGHTKRWTNSAFGGVMGITIGAHKLDVANVISAWFNSDYFHTKPMKADALTLAALTEKVGGEAEAQTILAIHLTSSLTVVNEFLKDVAVVNREFHGWLTRFIERSR